MIERFLKLFRRNAASASDTQWSAADRRAIAAQAQTALAINRLPSLSDETPPHFEPVRPLVKYTPPSGGGWVPVTDWKRNNEMHQHGKGWADMCAIEIWREDWPKSAFVFSSWLFQCSREFAIGLHWRPFEQGRLIPATWQ
jgi:hypothetical protein